jgi:hypothetical protein
MPLKKNNKTHQAFYPIVVLALILWMVYRSLFHFPVWFDESIGKAIFFGLPVWVYITMTGFRPIIDTFRISKLKPGLLRGVAIGGIYGLVMILVRALRGGLQLQSVPLFLADRFWIEMFLAILTSFWETLFFFSFVMSVVQDKFVKWSMARQVTLVSIIFVLFHIPNTFLRFQPGQVFYLISLLGLFAFGQSLLFYNKHNAYTLILSQALWGMVLLVYF